MLLRQIQIRSLTASTPKKRNAACRAAPVLATFLAAAYLSAGRGGNHESLALCGGTARRGAGGDISARDCHSTRAESVAHVRHDCRGCETPALRPGDEALVLAACEASGLYFRDRRECWPIVTALSGLPGFALEADPMIMTDARRQAGRSFLLTSPLKREDADGD
jgi:hypothetical protein